MDIKCKIAWITCKECNTDYPTCVFTGENDCETSELRSTTDTQSKTLYIYTTGNESPPGDEVKLLDVAHAQPLPNESFQEYKTRSRSIPSVYYYQCIACDSKKAIKESVLDYSELISKEYALVDLTRQ